MPRRVSPGEGVSAGDDHVFAGEAGCDSVAAQAVAAVGGGAAEGLAVVGHYFVYAVAYGTFCGHVVADKLHACACAGFYGARKVVGHWVAVDVAHKHYSAEAGVGCSCVGKS